MTNFSAVKAQLERTRQALVAKHRRGASGRTIAAALTSRLDALVKSIYTQSTHQEKLGLALLALGGYGRRELCFASDTDIMFLVRDDAEKDRAQVALNDLLHTLLDYGMQVGHSFRTVPECIKLGETDFETWTSLLDARFLCGNRELAGDFFRSLKRHIAESDKKTFVRLVLNSIELRHRKYGTSTKLLEPNIKNSAGGLRDLHTLFWVLSGTGVVALPGATRSSTLSVSALLSLPRVKEIASKELITGAKRAFDFLLRTRNEMHLQAQGLHDTLEFGSQRRVAEGLGKRSVEKFMQEYYVSARSVALLAQRAAGWAEHAYFSQAGRRSSTRHGKFQVVNGALEYRSQNGVLSTHDVLTAGLLSIEHQAAFSSTLEDRILRRVSSLRPVRSSENVHLLQRLLNVRQGLGTILQKYNDLGVLARLIPEWKPMVAYFQHNMYHYYTADEHTLMVVAAAESLANAENEMGRVFRSLPRRDALYLACLFHDIAKPVNTRSHERAGVSIAKKALARIGAKEIAEIVLFLIRHHLLMEQVAFRRNLSDPQTITEFAKHFNDPVQLDYLYVLTFADLSAVNKNVWTDWKGMLLSELYHKTRGLLTGEINAEQLHQSVAKQRITAHEEIIRSLSGTVAADDARKHLEAIESPAYASSFGIDEIAQHIRTIEAREPASALFTHRNNVTEVTVIAQDAPFALSKFCGVLTANDANIIDANIFTRNDGAIIDKFRVTDYVHKSALSAERCIKIQSELAEVYQGGVDIDHLLDQHRMKWKRRAKHLNPNTRVDVEFEDHPRYTIIDVYSFDMIGFLYTITGALSRLSLNIAFAKIATRADGIVDSFYVTDLEGKKLDHPERRAYVKTTLLAAIHKLAETELVTT
ncbi:MAG: [protein-PII] uridylyltransferase [Ignavibacteriae bacterium]|nr:[protein-PII] uridylyltransferase [Ignavibacteriota bacterium]